MPDGSPQTPTVDLDAYFRRIGFRGAARPDLATLRALHLAHPAAIPFEAVDVLLGRGISLAPADIDAKLIDAGRGGYCFEQNNLFQRVLETIGYEVTPMLGRVVWMRPPDAPLSGRTHMALKVEVEGETWFADVGFGGAVLTGPIRWRMDEAQPTPHEPFRLRDLGDEVILETRLDDWTPVYRLSRDRQLPVDFELGNWFTSTHPNSVFRNVLMVARTTPEARYALLDNRFTLRPVGGEAERRMLDAQDLERTLLETFGLPVTPEWRPVIQRAVASGDGV